MNLDKEIQYYSQHSQQNQQSNIKIQNLNIKNHQEQEQDLQISQNQLLQHQKKKENENNYNQDSKFQNQQQKKVEQKDEFQGEPRQKINISEKIIKLLNINPLNRTEEENHRIANTLKQVHFFKQISKQQTFELCIKNLRLLSIPKNTVLFKQGQSGDNFYIILSGEISISKQLVNNEQNLDYQNSTGQILKKSKFSYEKRQESTQKSDQQQEQSFKKLQSSKSLGLDIYQNQANHQEISQNQEKKTESKEQNILIQKNDKNNEDQQQKYCIDEVIQDTEQHQKQFLQFNGIDKQISSYSLKICNQLSQLTSLKILHQGDSFGELALLKPQNGTRQATAISQYQTELAYLSREDYQKILKENTMLSALKLEMAIK
ncbi:Cyclic nucleotide-binding protein [Pseudocohnilembus persalinus]|uniref:Cyclic nucleotide-binding protein n=1 Tax=Pseudocohnilembus persalinus TaxID=266149 RepID=A0A0V0QVP4_PSEPJ|nr:Cyclic nucleotide-binding protein [Pseudocohnilembus persalinus]|eukprot:KRX06483.1 Cyclic nucleotide-binding protein [Pseudocohnilembus persalinus]